MNEDEITLKENLINPSLTLEHGRNYVRIVEMKN